MLVSQGICIGNPHIPDAFEVHWSNLHYMAELLAFENTVATPTCHASDIQQLRTVDHVVI